MQVVSSYGAEIKNKNIPIRHTLALYREAVRCLTEIYETVWTELSMIDQIKRRFNEVSSYHTRLEQWKNGAISGKPKLVYENHAMPVFYRNVMYKPGEGSEDAACLKLYDGHDWKWFRAGLLHTDVEYLRRHWSGKKSSAPVLEKRHQKYYLRFSYTEEVTLSAVWILESIRMQSVVSCGQTELSWTGNLSISPVKKTGCPMYSEGSGDSRRNTVPSRSEADGRMRNV